MATEYRLSYTANDIEKKLGRIPNSEIATVEQVNSKSDKNHNHDDKYAGTSHNHDDKYDEKGSANTALNSSKEYTDEQITNMIGFTSVSTQLNEHNTSTSSHNDIRVLIGDLTTKLNNFLDVDDTTSDQLSEVLTLIENNKGTLESITTSKVNISDIIDNLITASSDKVLSANQGVEIKKLIDALQDAIDDLESEISNLLVDEIVDVITLPTENISSDITYRLLQGQFVSKGLFRYDSTCYIVEWDDTPSTAGESVLIKTEDGFAFNGYYNKKNNTVYGYFGTNTADLLKERVDASDLSSFEKLAAKTAIGLIGTGWKTLEEIFNLVGSYTDMSYGGVISSKTQINDVTKAYIYLTYADYIYRNNNWIQINDEILHGDGNSSEIFNSPLNIATGVTSHAEGYKTQALATQAHAEGYNTKASGTQSHAEGSNTQATATASHAEGQNTSANKIASHAEGRNTESNGEASHSEGKDTYAGGTAAHAEGGNTRAAAYYAHAEGSGTQATGTAAHVEGGSCIASGRLSHAEGYETIAASTNQHVQGEYNIEDKNDKYAHIVGNGTSTKRSNAHTLDWSGNAWYQGDVYVGGTNQSDAEKLVKQSELPDVSNFATRDELPDLTNYASKEDVSTEVKNILTDESKWTEEEKEKTANAIGVVPMKVVKEERTESDIWDNNSFNKHDGSTDTMYILDMYSENILSSRDIENFAFDFNIGFGSIANLSSKVYTFKYNTVNDDFSVEYNNVSDEWKEYSVLTVKDTNGKTLIEIYFGWDTVNAVSGDITQIVIYNSNISTEPLIEMFTSFGISYNKTWTEEIKTIEEVNTVILKSPNGNRFKLTVTDDGTLALEAVNGGEE